MYLWNKRKTSNLDQQLYLIKCETVGQPIDMAWINFNEEDEYGRIDKQFYLVISSVPCQGGNVFYNCLLQLLNQYITTEVNFGHYIPRC